MDLLHSGRFDGFCLVSSDSDFTRLPRGCASRAPTSSGSASRRPPESFRQACRRFIYTENLLPESPAAAQNEGTARKALQPPSAAVPILNRVIAEMDSEDGWVGLGVVGQRLANIASDFDPRTFGYRKLSDLVRKTGAFEIDQSDAASCASGPSRRAGPSRRRGGPRAASSRVRDVALELVQPDLGVAVGRRAPVAARGERAAGGDLGAVGHRRALELAEAEEALHEHAEPLLDRRQVVGVGGGRPGSRAATRRP